MPEWIRSAPDLEKLAAAIGVPSGALEETVERWNALVAAGADDDFGRGISAYDGWCGDRRFYPSAAATSARSTCRPITPSRS